MSLIICVHVGEGIVMASDSRATYGRMKKEENREIHQIGVHTTDTTDKTFLCPGNIGISTCGDGSVKGKPITGYIETFIREKINTNTDIDTIPDMMINYFGQFDPVPNTIFFIAGHKKMDSTLQQRFWQVNVKKKEKSLMKTEGQGASWAGEKDVLSKLIQPVWERKAEDKFQQIPHSEISWNFFTLQDAAEFAEYAIKTTVDTMKFQNRNKTVGGPIDILILKPEEAFWLRKKRLG